MNESFTRLNEKILESWKISAKEAGIPVETYNPDVRVIEKKTGRGFSYGLIHNPYRYARPMDVAVECPLCEVIGEVKNNPLRRIDRENNLLEHIVIPNRFPLVEGVSIAIHEGTGKDERAMYKTSQISDCLSDDFARVFEFSDLCGFEALHNGVGLGASIGRHEHWHLANYGWVYDKIGREYGFEEAVKEDVKGYKGLKRMPDYEFAHLIFEKNDAGRAIHFLKRIGAELGKNFPDGNVPHSIYRGREGVLVVPARNYMERGIGSGETAGHIVVKTKEEFDRADYDFCTKVLSNRLFLKEEMNLERFS